MADKGGAADKFGAAAQAKDKRSQIKENRKTAQADKLMLPKERVDELRAQAEQGKPRTQRLVEQGDILCFCNSFRDCERKATLHAFDKKNACEYCYGIKCRVHPKAKMYRYYPCDDKWDAFRDMCIDLREGIEDQLPADV